MIAIILVVMLLGTVGMTVRWLAVSRREDEKAVNRVMEATAANKKELGIMSSLSPLAGALVRTKEVGEMSRAPLLRALGQKVEASGMFGRSLDVFVAYQIAAVAAGSFLMLVAASGIVSSLMYRALILIFAILVAMYPISSVDRRFKKAMTATSDDLPDYIEVLQIALLSGMTARASLKFAADRMDQDSTFVKIIRQLLTDLQVAPQGSESGAYYTAGASIGTNDAKAFFGALAQSDIRGIPVTDILENQADLMREVRVQERNKQASKLPSKMTGITWLHTFPLILTSIAANLVVNIQSSGIV